MNNNRGFVEVLLIVGIVLAIVAILGVTYLGSQGGLGPVESTPTPTIDEGDIPGPTLTPTSAPPTPTVADTDLQETDSLLDSVSADDFSGTDLNDASLGL